MRISRRDGLKLASAGLLAALAGPALSACGLVEAVGVPRFLPRTRRPDKLLVVDTTGLAPEDVALLASLQGLVNRAGHGPALFLVQRHFDTAWLATALSDIPQQALSAGELKQMLAGFAHSFNGAVVYDPSQLSHENALPYTKNLAATYAGLHDVLLATRAQAEALGLPVRLDLTGRFPDEDAAYRWALDHLWPDCTQAFVVSEEPVLPGYLYDFAVATRAFCFTFNPFRPKQQLMAAQLYDKMTANGLLLGWWSNGSSGRYEWAAVETTSRHGVGVVAANFFTNATVWSGVPAPEATEPTLDAKQEAQRLLAAGKRTFMALQVSDGDNAGADQATIFDLWRDPARGQVPVSWSLDPVLVELAPAMLAYFRRTATANDGFATGPSGCGYMYANLWPTAQLAPYVARTARAMRQGGIPIPWVWPNPNGPATLTDSVLQPYLLQIQPAGMLLGSGTGPRLQWVGETPCVWLSGGTSPVFAPPVGGYLFGAHEVVLWNYTMPQIVQLGRQLEASGTTLVLPEVLFWLMRLTRGHPAA